MLVENEGEARRYLERAASEELKGTFGEEFWNSTGELISQFTDLGSSDLAVIRQRQGDVDAARRKLGILRESNFRGGGKVQSR